MELRLKNIGIIKDSTIKLDGLTVITGHNNSGKTTVGKAVFSIIDAVSKLDKKYEIDKRYYLIRIMDKMLDSLQLPYGFRQNEINDDRVIIRFIFRKYREQEDIESFFYELRSEIEITNFSEIYKEVGQIGFRELFTDNEQKAIKKNKDRAIEIWERANSIINSDPFLADYARMLIERTLNTEFDYQINPARYQDMTSSIVLNNGSEAFFDINIENNKITKDTHVYINTPFENAHFIDSVYAIDLLNPQDDIVRVRHKIQNEDEEFVSTSRRTLWHVYRLNNAIRRITDISVLEEKEIDISVDNIDKILNTVIPGKMLSQNERTYYVEEGLKIGISSLATGSKLLLLVKTLLYKGELHNGSLLILDEPEAHLHPQWQNVFAEIIILLVKEMNICVLLTTHSPNLALAIETYMRKYQINDKCNFYQTHHYEDNYFVDYECVNDNLNEIYSDFVKYFSEMKALRSLYTQGD